MMWPTPWRLNTGSAALRRVDRAQDVDVHQPSRDVRRRVVERAVKADAGVADHDVEPAKRGDRTRDERVHVGVDGDVAGTASDAGRPAR